MNRNSLASIGLLILCLCYPLRARPHFAANLPDLTVKQYEFDSYNDKRLRVQIANIGKAASGPCRLALTIRQIKGSAVNRAAYEAIPAIEPGKVEWVTVSATGILQSAISLKDTTFRLTVDDSRVVAESNEDNNETWNN